MIERRLIIQAYATEELFDVNVNGDNAELIECVSTIFNKMIEMNPDLVNKETIFRLLNEYMEV